jgi:hypothetical protein
MPDKTYDILIDIRSEAKGLETATAQVKQLKADVASAATSQASIASTTFTAAENLGNATAPAAQVAKSLAEANAALSVFQAELGIAALVGGEVWNIVSNLADEAVRVATEYEKGTTELERQATAWLATAKAAGEFHDVVRLVATQLPALDAFADKASEAARKKLDLFEQVQDAVFRASTLLTSGIAIPGPKASLLDQEQQDAKRLADNALKASNALADVGIKSEQAFQHLRSIPLNDAVVQLTKNVVDAKAKLDAIDLDKGLANKHEWEKQAEVFLLATSRLTDFTAAQTKVALEAGRIDDAVQRTDLSKLDKTERLPALQQELVDIQSKLRQLGVDATSPNDYQE